MPSDGSRSSEDVELTSGAKIRDNGIEEPRLDAASRDLLSERITTVPAATPVVPFRNLELRHLHAFLSVAKELHFTHAAERLHLTQQALSTQIRQLEMELGTPLFRRTTRRVEFTEAGETLFEHAKSIVAAIDSAWKQTQRTANGEIGTLSIAHTPSVAPATLPALIDGMRDRFPSVDMRTYECWRPEAFSGVISGRVKFALVRTNGPVDDLESMLLREEALGVVLGKGHRLARRRVLSLQDLADETLAIWPRDLAPDYYDLVTGFYIACGFRGTIKEFETVTREFFFGDPVSRTEIAACRAFSVAYATEKLPSGFIWRPVDPAPRVPLSMFWRPSAEPSIRRFVEVAEAVATARKWQPS